MQTKKENTILDVVEMHQCSLILHRNLTSALRHVGYKNLTIEQFEDPKMARVREKIFGLIGNKSQQELCRILERARLIGRYESINILQLNVLEFAIYFNGSSLLIKQLKEIDIEALKLMTMEKFLAQLRLSKSQSLQWAQLSHIAFLELRRLTRKHLLHSNK